MVLFTSVDTSVDPSVYRHVIHGSVVHRSVFVEGVAHLYAEVKTRRRLKNSSGDCWPTIMPNEY